jgi:hypothetical protein
MTNESHEYQVVFEFHGDDSENFNRVIALETKLEEELSCGDIDGHDVGNGIVNIFINTSEPIKCFEEAIRIMANLEPIPVEAGYRNFEEEDYIRLLPEDNLMPFKLK